MEIIIHMFLIKNPPPAPNNSRLREVGRTSYSLPARGYTGDSIGECNRGSQWGGILGVYTIA